MDVSPPLSRFLYNDALSAVAPSRTLSNFELYVSPLRRTDFTRILFYFFPRLRLVS